ncbi:MAG: 23S rRNA (guanine(2445)-N(2))/(guanine(2069)-N(7))-methyltransferase, partial [Spirochaetota bacterium]|nr:23S rRNA (guanine(2445)-N(2))/(guanine(2069)-N(7))-methyltransferase [Spirochaetota bacterium]
QDSMEFLRTDLDQYELIFIDPPTFSNRKGASDVFDVQRDHGMMIDLAVQRLAPCGLIIFSNNFRRFAMDPEIEERYLVEEISRDTIPADFERNPKIHRTWFIRRRG